MKTGIHELNSKKIGIVTRHSYPSDQEVRVTKLAKTFFDAGFKVIVFCPESINDNVKTSYVSPELEICSRVGNNGSFWSKVFHSPLPISIPWGLWLFKKFQRADITLVVVRDLRLFLPAYFSAKILGVKVVLDIGEHYPGMVEILGKHHWSHAIIRNSFLIKCLEKLSVYLADQVWVVADENRERLKALNKNIDVVGNSPMDDSWKTHTPSPIKKYSDDGEVFTLLSFGIVDNIRGLDFAISVLKSIQEVLPNVQLMIFGDGEFRDTIECQITELDLASSVIMKGWVPSAQKYECLLEGDIGIIFHKVCDLTNHTIPNKLYDYMSIGLPVASSQLLPVKRIVEQEHCGIIVSDDVAIAAKALIEFIEDYDARSRASSFGRKAMELGYSWREDEKTVLETLSRM